MSTRNRPRQTDRPDSDVYDDEFGLVTDADIDAYLAEQDLEEETESKKEAGFLNLQTASGLGLIGLGALYSLQQLGILGLARDLSGLVTILPILASVLIMLTGFGVLSWSPATRRRRKARERAARARTKASRKTMGRSESDRSTSPATAAATAAFGLAGKAVLEAGRTATRAAEVAFAEQQARNRRSGRDRSKRLTKDRRNRKIAGVAAGIANYTGLDPTLVRIAFVALAIFSQGIAIPLYFVLAMALPNAPRPSDDPYDDDPFVRVSDD